MKAKILTWFHYDNYGTLLQAYAMQQIVKNEIDQQALIINYNPLIKQRKKKSELIVSKKFWKNKLNNFPYFLLHLTKIEKKNRGRAFDQFRNKFLMLTSMVKTKSELNNVCQNDDIVICGSDQIWNPNNFDSTYFLDFLNNNQKKASLSPSFGVDDIDESSVSNDIKKYLKSFNNISVREETGKKILSEIDINEVDVTLDPTLLLNKNDWESLIKDIDLKIDKKYALVYFLGNNNEYWKFIKNYCKQKNIELKIVPVHDKDYFRKGVIKNGVGPLEFLKYIHDADICFTDSFHCTIFSNIFRKNIIVFDRFSNNDKKSQNSRVNDYLNRFDLLGIKYSGDFNISTPNYEIYEKKLESYKEKTFDFINNIRESSKTIEQPFKICNTCSGCGMCQVICPKNAIEISLNGSGFYHYEVNENKCIHCNLCKNVCSFSNIKNIKEIEYGNLFKVKSKSINIVDGSTSGGVCYEIANYYNSRGYSIIGCSYDKKNKIAKHILIDENRTQDLNLMNKSKYIQSDTQVFKKLNSLKSAVIFGLPCQIASINNYLVLKNKRDSFILIELICHGVPSYLLFSKYLDEQKIINPNVEFRYKQDKVNWKKKRMKIWNNKKNKIIKSSKSEFYTFFELAKCLNKSCYECNFRNKSGADLRVGDYWSDKEKNNYSGINMVISMTEKGEQTLNNLIKTDAIYCNCMNNSDYFNCQQIENVIKPSNYDEIIYDLKDKHLTLKKIIFKDFLTEYLFYKISDIYKFIRKVIKDL